DHGGVAVRGVDPVGWPGARGQAPSRLCRALLLIARPAAAVLSIAALAIPVRALQASTRLRSGDEIAIGAVTAVASVATPAVRRPACQKHMRWQPSPTWQSLFEKHGRHDRVQTPLGNAPFGACTDIASPSMAGDAVLSIS